MLTTNLLPPQSQKAVRLEEVRRIIRFFAIGIAFILAFGLLILAPSYFLNIAVRQELERSLALEKEASARLGVGDLTARISATSRVFRSLKENVSLSVRASRVSDEIFNRAGSGIEIKQLSIRAGDVVMRGRAAARRDLLDFEKRLRESEMIQDISSPLKNIIKETDITFDIQVRLKPKFNL